MSCGVAGDSSVLAEGLSRAHGALPREGAFPRGNEIQSESATRRRFLRGAALLGAGVTLARAPSLAAQAPALPGGPIAGLDALALSEAIRSRAMSCTEVMKAYLAQIETHNPRVNAIVSLRSASELLAEAKTCDAELARGQWRGWMHGMPYAAKDLVGVRGLRTSSGTPLTQGTVATSDSVFIGRIRAAGALFIGKTNVPEFGYGSQSYNPVFGVTRNAWDATRTSGGSSGGAAVALALRMVPVADGSDMMGSLRNPAGWNNVIGFRPTLGTVPGDGPDYIDLLSTAGPMARNVPDAARLLSTMAGQDPRDPLSLDIDPARFAAPLETALRGLRIGWLGDYGGYLPMEEGVLPLCRKALASVEALGCTVSDASPGFDMSRLWQAWLVLRHWGAAAWARPLYQNPKTRAQLKPELVWEVEGGLGLTGEQVSEAMATRAKWYAAISALFERFDVLALPTAQVFPFDAATHWPQEVAGRAMDTYHRWMEVVIGGTMSGCPIVAVPAGFSATGLPMGLQLIGPLRRDIELLRAGHVFSRAAGFLERTPPGL